MFAPDELYLLPVPAWSVKATNKEATCCSFCPDGNFAAFSNSPGSLQIVSTLFGEERQSFSPKMSSSPIVSCHFHPTEEDFIVFCSKDGYIFLYNYSTGECPILSRHLGSSILTMNVDCLGEIFAIGCADGSIRIYDIETMERKQALVKIKQRSTKTSSNDIFSVVFHPEDSNIIATAGWNDRVFIWDVRTGQNERSIIGPHIRGDGLDIRNDCLVTASAREKKQIEVFDFGTGKKMREIQWDSQRANGPCTVTNLKIARNGMSLIVGGTGSYFTQVFDFATGNLIGQTMNLSASSSMVGISPYSSAVIAGSENGDILCQMIRVKERK